MCLTSNSAPPSQARCGSKLTLPDFNTVNPAADLAAILKKTGATLPQVSSGGTMTVTLLQVNFDGAGPMKCSIDVTAQGASFQAMTITTNVPGTNGKSNAANQDFVGSPYP